MDLQSLAIILYSTSLQCLWAIVWNQLTSHHWKWWRHCLWSLLKQASCAHCSCVSIPTDMYQVPVQRLDRIRTSRKRVKEILTDIGLNSCQDFLKVGSSLKKLTTNKVLYKWFKNDIKRGTKRMSAHLKERHNNSLLKWAWKWFRLMLGFPQGASVDSEEARGPQIPDTLEGLYLLFGPGAVSGATSRS